MINNLIYVLVAAVAIYLGMATIRGQLRAMDERDQDAAVAHYANVKGRSIIDKSQRLKDEMAALVKEIKSRWRMTPEELTQSFYRRHGCPPRRLNEPPAKGSVP
jgi:hypothetical protein